MVIYKGYRFVYLGFKRWRVMTPNKQFFFDIIFKGGIPEMMERVDIWRSVIDDNNRT